MSAYPWPRFFLPSEQDADGSLDDGIGARAPTEPAFVLDAFVHTRGDRAREVFTGLDILGALALSPSDPRDALLASVRGHLAHAEVIAPARRRIDAAAEGLWLFSLELMEQLPDAPGANDPVYLYGTMWPADDASAPGRRGQLATTRGDVLRGLVDGLRWAFRYPSDEAERVPRALHLMLPGDREDALCAGRGLVLAYPAMDPDLLGSHGGNELQALALFHDLLAALRVDPEHAADESDPLPVPDLTGFVKDLVDDGWVVSEDGRTATRVATDAGFFRRMLRPKETIELPLKASLEDYARRAAAELGRLTAWPSAASRALFGRVGAWTGPPPRAATNVASRAETPRAPAPAPPSPTPPSPPPPSSPAARPAPRDDWMKDFVAEHAAARPQLTRVRPQAPPPVFGRPGRVDWMKDFD